MATLFLFCGRGPAAHNKAAVKVPPCGSVTDTESLEPVPVGIWNLSVGGRTLWKNSKAEVTIKRQ